MGALAGHSLQSGLREDNREIGALFARISMNYGEPSHQSRLRGGEGGIRTLDTGVSPYNGLANETVLGPAVRIQ